jgi:ubiquinone/menaquinone biosynthesis C-methylase UbiE
VAKHYCSDVPLYSSQLAFLGDYLSPGSIVLDVGCADAKQFESIASLGCRYVGIDRSVSMLREAGLRRTASPAPCVLLADATRLPFPTASVDWVLSLNNTLGILPSWRARQLAVEEMLRVCRRGALIEHLVAEVTHEVEARYFKDALGRNPPYVSARFSRDYFAPFRHDGAFRLNFVGFIRKSTNATHYALAAFTRRTGHP